MNNAGKKYIKVIYLLEQTNNKVRVTDIAEKIGVTKPSVNAALNNLKEQGFINYEIYGDITLTSSGKKIATTLLTRENVIEIFLNGVLEVEEDKSIEEAKILENTMSEDTYNKLYNYIKNILNLNDVNCGCDYNPEKDNCKNCNRGKIYTKINKNNKWKAVIEEDK